MPEYQIAEKESIEAHEGKQLQRKHNCYVPVPNRVACVVSPAQEDAPLGPGRLLSTTDFRRVYLASAASQIGDAFNFVAVMWFAIVLGGPLGVIAVRIAGSLPALLFGLHGGLVADRWDRRRTMIAADLVRGTVLLPIAIAGLTGQLPLWGLVPAGFVVATATSYFVPAYGAFLPSVVGRANLQQANGLVGATNNVLGIAGWAVAAALLAAVSVGSFFAVNAASYFVSAALLTRVRSRAIEPPDDEAVQPQLRHGFTGMRVRPGLSAAVAMLGIGMTVMTGVWTVGIAELARSSLGHGASGLSLLLTATALGAIASSVFLSKRRLRRKVFTSCMVWSLLLPGYLLLAFAETLPAALVGTCIVGATTGAAFILVSTAAQESVQEDLLGRVMGIVFLGNVGAKPVGLLLIAPLYIFFDPSVMFVAGGVAVFVCALAAAATVDVATRRFLAAGVAG
jgi:transmembrane secretion effector